MSLYQHEPRPHRPHNVNRQHRQEQEAAGFNQRLAVLITKAFGTIQAFYILVVWMFAWMILASAGIWLFANDRYPFPFLLFCSNLIQLWALPVLAVGQQVLGRKAELQADAQFNDVVMILHDSEQVMNHLDKQDEAILEILKRLEARV